MEQEHSGAIAMLIDSMRFEGMGGYGDFGRYVYQRSLHSFDVDERAIFNYSVYYILNELGYSEECFGDYDKRLVSFDRHLTLKTERIGKKYQWIAMYNILARIVDHYKMVDRWSYPEKQDVQFEGPWEPCVRDFDPTLNKSFMEYNEAPIFSVLKEHVLEGISENKTSDISTPYIRDIWLETLGLFLGMLDKTLILNDDNGNQWICLTKYCDTGRNNLNEEKLLVWSWLYAYFVTPEQANLLLECSEKGLSVLVDDIVSHHESTTIFNREYPWSPSCTSFEEYAWVDAQILTGEYETITEKHFILDDSFLEGVLKKYGVYDNDGVSDENYVLENGGESFDDAENMEPKYREQISRRMIKKSIGRILHSTTTLLWEGEFDASQDTAISINVPCGKLIEEMGLKQLEYSGFFFDRMGKLAAFDTKLTQL